MGTDSNPGGVGGRRKRIPSNKPRGKTSHRSSDGCAVTALALGSAAAGAFGLACWAIAEAVQAVI